MYTSAVLVALVAACIPPCASAQVTAPLALGSGEHRLRALDGKPLPGDVSFPPFGPPNVRALTYPAYRVWVTAGSLTLDVQTMRFSFWYEQRRNAPDSAVFSRPSRAGTFEQHGNDLVFHVVLEHGGHNTLWGTVGPSTVRIVDGAFKLDFDR